MYISFQTIDTGIWMPRKAIEEIISATLVVIELGSVWKIFSLSAQ